MDAQARERFAVPPELNVELDQRDQVRAERARAAAAPITGALNTFLEQIRERQEQTVDHSNLDTLIGSDWERDAESARRP